MCPLALIIASALVIYTIGLAGLAGLGVSVAKDLTDQQVLALSAPVQALLFTSMIRIRKEHLAALDNRTQTLTEVVRNLHSIKLFAYETLFSGRIAEKREKEARYAQQYVTVRSAGGVVANCIPAVAAVGELIARFPLTIVTFTVYSAMGNSLDLGKTFATLAFFNFMQFPLMILPRQLAVIADIINSSREFCPVTCLLLELMHQDVSPIS